MLYKHWPNIFTSRGWANTKSFHIKSSSPYQVVWPFRECFFLRQTNSSHQIATMVSASLANESWTSISCHWGQPLHSSVLISAHSGTPCCRLKRTVLCSLWSNYQHSNTFCFGLLITALPSDFYSNFTPWFTIALSGKYQQCSVSIPCWIWPRLIVIAGNLLAVW